MVRFEKFGERAKKRILKGTVHELFAKDVNMKEVAAVGTRVDRKVVRIQPLEIDGHDDRIFVCEVDRHFALLA